MSDSDIELTAALESLIERFTKESEAMDVLRQKVREAWLKRDKNRAAASDIDPEADTEVE